MRNDEESILLLSKGGHGEGSAHRLLASQPLHLLTCEFYFYFKNPSIHQHVCMWRGVEGARHSLKQWKLWKEPWMLWENTDRESWGDMQNWEIDVTLLLTKEYWSDSNISQTQIFIKTIWHQRTIPWVGIIRAAVTGGKEIRCNCTLRPHYLGTGLFGGFLQRRFLDSKALKTANSCTSFKTEGGGEIPFSLSFLKCTINFMFIYSSCYTVVCE